MNSHCHVQGRAAQGQLIAFMIMISRQIYRACSDHFSRAADAGCRKWVYGCRLAQASRFSTGGSFWLTTHRWLEVNHLLFSCKSFALLPGFPLLCMWFFFSLFCRIPSWTSCLFTGMRHLTQLKHDTNHNSQFPVWTEKCLFYETPWLSSDLLMLICMNYLDSFYIFQNCSLLFFLMLPFLFFFYFLLLLFENHDLIEMSGV